MPVRDQNIIEIQSISWMWLDNECLQNLQWRHVTMTIWYSSTVYIDGALVGIYIYIDTPYGARDRILRYFWLTAVPLYIFARRIVMKNSRKKVAFRIRQRNVSWQYLEFFIMKILLPLYKLSEIGKKPYPIQNCPYPIQNVHVTTNMAKTPELKP